MKRIALLIATIITLTFSAAVSNGQTEKVQACAHPFPYLIESFNPYETESMEARFRAFYQSLKAAGPDARGVVSFYGGKDSFLDELNQLEKKISGIFKRLEPNGTESHAGTFGHGIHIRRMGYKAIAEVEVSIMPLECTNWPESSAEFEFEEVNLREAPIEQTTFLTSEQFEKRFVRNAAPACPAAALAVRVCTTERTVNVLAIIDTEGGVVYARGTSGHPLLKRSGANAIQEWKFMRLDGDRRYLRGTILIKFKVDNTVLVNN